MRRYVRSRRPVSWGKPRVISRRHSCWRGESVWRSGRQRSPDRARRLRGPCQRGPRRADCARWGACHGAGGQRPSQSSQRGPAAGTRIRDANTSAFLTQRRGHAEMRCRTVCHSANRLDPHIEASPSINEVCQYTPHGSLRTYSPAPHFQCHYFAPLQFPSANTSALRTADTAPTIYSALFVISPSTSRQMPRGFASCSSAGSSDCENPW